MHWGGAVMWIGGDAIMLGLMMLVFLMWSRDDRAATRGQGWLEAVRKSNFDDLVGTPAVPGEARRVGPPSEPSEPSEASSASEAGAAKGASKASSASGIDDDEHLAAYNAYLARLNEPRRGADGRR